MCLHAVGTDAPLAADILRQVLHRVGTILTFWLCYVLVVGWRCNEKPSTTVWAAVKITVSFVSRPVSTF